MRIKELEASVIKKKNPRKAAVMALFYPDFEQVTHLLLILRKTYEGVHSNQIGFPGGKVEKGDADLLTTALRETHEEVGVAPAQINVLRALSEVYIPPSNFEVRPYMGLCQKPTTFKIDKILASYESPELGGYVSSQQAC